MSDEHRGLADDIAYCADIDNLMHCTCAADVNDCGVWDITDCPVHDIGGTA